MESRRDPEGNYIRRGWSPGAWIRRQLWEEKLLNPLGALLLLVFSCGLAWLVSHFGIISGLLVASALVAIPLVYMVVVYPKFGIVALIAGACFLFFLLRLGVNFPIGTLMDALEWLLILGTIISYRRNPDGQIFKNAVGVLVAVWVAYTLLQVVNPSAASQLAWLYTVRSVGAVTLMYYVFCYHIRSIQYIRFLIGFWLCCAALGALYGYKQEYLGFSDNEFQDLVSDPLKISLLFIDGHWRKYSLFSDPVAFAYNMAMAFFICISLVRPGIKPVLRWTLLGIAGLCVSAMMFSGTRGAYVLIPAGLVLYFILRMNKRILWMAGIAVVALGGLITVPTSNPTLYRFQTAFRPSDDASFNVRKKNQKLIQPYIQTHPFGGGLGATGVWGERFAPDSFLAGFPPDSGYLRVAVELGWIGLLLFCLLIFFILKTGIDNYFLLKNAELKSYCLAMTLVVFILGVGNYPQEAIVQFPSNVLFYLAAAILQCTARVEESAMKKY